MGDAAALLVGMQPPPEDTFRRVMRLNQGDDGIDQWQTALRLKRKELAEEVPRTVDRRCTNPCR